MKDFFVSYNKQDKQWAEWLAWTLEEAGYTVVIQAWDFRPGGNFVLDMNRASAECEKTIAVLSANYLQSEYAQSEWSAAFAVDPQSLQRKLIPVRVGVCKPEGVLKTIVYVDLVGVTEPSDAKQRVLDALKARAKPDQEPTFPGAVPISERTEPEPVVFPPTEEAAAVQRAAERVSEPAAEPEPQSGRKREIQRILNRGRHYEVLEVLKPFQFEVVTVNQRGQEISRKRREAESFTEDLGNGIGLELVSIPGGTFIMGAPKTEAESRDEERPQHLVRVKPFFMGKFPITQEQWFAVSELPKVNHNLDPNCSGFKGLKRPVECVTWLEAVEFCDRLFRQTGREYRLPSEAEWEYTCRSGTTTPFHFGETITTALANYDGTDRKDFGWSGSYGQGPKGVYREQTTDVGTFPPNAFGLYDLHGNVGEWCLDHYHENYPGAPTDGSAWIEGGNSELRVLRGGTWHRGPRICRSASRSHFRLDGPNDDDCGFRIVCSAL